MAGKGPSLLSREGMDVLSVPGESHPNEGPHRIPTLSTSPAGPSFSFQTGGVGGSLRVGQGPSGPIRNTGVHTSEAGPRRFGGQWKVWGVMGRDRLPKKKWEAVARPRRPHAAGLCWEIRISLNPR